MAAPAYMLGDILSRAFINSKVFSSMFPEKPFAFLPFCQFSLCFFTFFPINMGPIIESKHASSPDRRGREENVAHWSF